MRAARLALLGLLLGLLLYLVGVGVTTLLVEHWDREDPTLQWYPVVEWPKGEVWT